MVNKRKNEAKTDVTIFNYLSDDRIYWNEWLLKKTDNKQIQECLNVASKSWKRNRGEPDLIYINEKKELLILIENKDSIKDHESKKINKPQQYAVDGIKHYLSFFTEKELSKQEKTVQKYIKGWKIVGIAFSWNIYDEYNHAVSTFAVKDWKEIVDMDVDNILNEDEYVSYFENIDLEEISNNISKSSSEINRMLRSIDSQKRPVLLSALMICLYDKKNINNDFKKTYSKWWIKTIISNIDTTITTILSNEWISIEKINVLKNEIAFIETDEDLKHWTMLKDILIELENNVIPLFNKRSNYDIIWKFYEEFLRYAWVANVKKGIVLTPNHITKLFTELIDIKKDDVILDACCGTWAFLIAGMNKLIDEINLSSYSDKHERINMVKQNQLVWFEKSSTMYALAISNMLFRGDWKSRIHHLDFFSEVADEELEKLNNEWIKPTIWFINPPYWWKDNDKNPTKKEIQFLEKMLNSVSRYWIMIAPLSTFFKNNDIRNRILKKNTLKYVINMPNELFQPNAYIHTAIAVFETNLPHNDKEVVMYDMKEDWFVLSKNKWRTDVYDKRSNIKIDLFEKINNAKKYDDNLSIMQKSIIQNDEWIIQAHSKKDNTWLLESMFIKTIKNYFIFSVKSKLNILWKKIDEVTMIEILLDNYRDVILNDSKRKSSIDLQSMNWWDLKYEKIFSNIWKGARLIETDRKPWNTLYFSASDSNNGLTDSISDPLFTEKDAIIYTTFWSAFYVEWEFTASDEVSIFKHEKMTIYSWLFIATVMTQNKYKYTFWRKAFKNKFINDTISLPIDKAGNPDREYMENYIKSLPYSSSL